MSKSFFCAFDTETSGLKPRFHEIISFSGVILNKELQVLSHLTVHAHPDHIERLEKGAQKVNGYTREGWDAKGAVTQEAMQRKVQDFLTGHKFLYPIGHNIKFDRDFLEPFIGEKFYGKVFSYHSLDTIGLALFCDLFMHNQQNNMYGLKPLCVRYSIPLENEHDAKSDIKATIKIFEYLLAAARGEKTIPEPVPPEESCFVAKLGSEYLFRYGKYKYNTVEDILGQDGEEAARYLNKFVLRDTQLTNEARYYIEQCLHTYRQNTA